MRAVKQYLKKFAVARKVHSVISGPKARRQHGTYRFIHIDASHGYRETFKELEMAEQLPA